MLYAYHNVRLHQSTFGNIDMKFKRDGEMARVIIVIAGVLVIPSFVKYSVYLQSNSVPALAKLCGPSTSDVKSYIF